MAVKSSCKNRLEGIVMDSSATGQTVFIAPRRSVELHNELAINRQEENEEIRKILLAFTDEIVSAIENLTIINNELIGFDIYHSIASFCRDNDYNSPVVVSDKHVRIINGRHPLLDKDAIPLNLELGDKFKILVITGPNTGGKTVALKTLGIFTLMIQCGIGIPADPMSEFPLFTGIYVDIGDEQSIEQSLSTFSSHITRIIHTLKRANVNSLVILDEIGAGTDPTEGSALGIGILKKLKKIGALSVVTTHYSALKHFASDEPGIENASMEFDITNLKPTYRLLVGIPGSSHAMEISKRLGMPDEILDEAYKNLNEEYINTEKMIEKLENERLALQEQSSKLNEYESKLKLKEEELSIMKNEFMEKEKQLKKIEKTRSFEFLNDARKEFENIIKELRTNNASKENILNGKNFFEKISDELDKKNDDDTGDLSVHKFVTGDEVRIMANRMKGSIIGISNNDNEFIVQVGIVKLNLKANEIEYIGKKKQETIHYEKPAVNYVPSDPAISLDLRGARYDEAERKLDKFVENAIAGKLSYIRIIHGKGSGAIRKCIQDYLEHSPFITSFEYEKDSNYGTNFGITVAKLR